MVQNTRAKGNRIERKAEDRLEDQGYNTARKNNSRYGASDFYNLYDIVAVKPGEPVKFIQVKANSFPNLTDFKHESKDIIPEEHAEVELWCHHDRVGWEVRRLNRIKKEWVTLVDERDHDCKIGEKLKKVLNE
jgi:Holliday junction resolvase